MKIKRLIKHLLLPPWLARRTFSPAVMRRIEDAVRQSERLHRGELRVAVEASLDLGPLLRNQSPRARACEVFAQLGVWDTADNSGVLLYINWVDRDIEIVADRGISARVTQAQWEAICRVMEQAFREQRFEAGLLEGIRQITTLLAQHFPATADNPDELGNRPVLL
ncbi:MAG: TPM domain-containing protein [Burkholderiales bacterium]|nr:TPM domain-containing protein [Burkholderiales bacterium]